MSYYAELLCDADMLELKPGSRIQTSWRHKCQSVFTGLGETRRKQLRLAAKEQGWRRVRFDGCMYDICPNCYRASTEPEQDGA